MERKVRAARLSGAYVLAIAAVLAFANVVSYRLDKRYDVTKNERFTLSKGSANLVSEGLQENLKLSLYVTRGLPKLDLFVEDLTNLMTEYERASKGKVSYVLTEPKTDEEREKAKEAGLQMAPFGEGTEGGDQATITQGFMGLVLSYGAEKDVIPILSPESSQGLEFWITNKIRNLRDKVHDSYPKIGLVKKEGITIDDDNLVPAGGRGGGPTMKAILGQHFPFYKFEDVVLEDGKKEIDEKLNGLIVTQADKAWTDAELARIDQFLMRGDKSLLVLAGAVNMKAADAAMKGELDLRNLDKLMLGYGIEMKKEAVLEWGTPMRIPVQDQSGRATWLFTPGVLALEHYADAEEKEQLLDNGFVGFFRMDQIAVPFPSTLVAKPEKQPEAKYRTVLRSSANSTVEVDSPVDLSMKTDWKPRGEFGQRDIAIEVSGVLKSAFADKKPEGFEGEVPASSKSPSRVLVIASGQFLANPFARAGNPPPMPPQMAMMGSFGGDPNLQAIARFYAMPPAEYLSKAILSFKNLLDWVTNDTDLMAASAKLLGEPALTYANIARPKFDLSKDDDKAIQRKLEEVKAQRKVLQSRVQWSLTLLPSLAFMAFGLLRWRARENNRASVKLPATKGA
ncbi:MAG: hypothetical protein EXR75_04860 [Myxococcales bacterium]|nr:hypothetical protein [Myxococcales bacterium]